MNIAVIFPLVAPTYVARGAARLFAKIESREIFLRCVELYTPREEVTQRIVVAPPDDLPLMQERYSAHLGFQGVSVAGGGSDWFSCVGRALEKVKEEIDAVIVHDPCCPAVPFTMLDALEEALEKNKGWSGVVPVLPSRSAFSDTDGEGAGKRLQEYVDMSAVSEVQSPQIFRRAALVEAYARRAGASFVDDAELVLTTGHKIGTIGGSRLNMRIDTDEMVRLGKDLIEHLPKPKSRTPLDPFGEAQW
jgi:2-C-methyl-D-erythritol 4-phosphate cytidylyltransferase